ncbi:hypothetical protein Pcinc_003313 [Petrolisthes cinctipes]|uniref:PiggyBac transposable element-derived protein 4 C-terminal zinc-finger domain-containing protein n=1 Tax=Petrolisthes cinctipes TaxID=88211 RepID=A0AAE1GHZ1_PETCI|nr:hypothetical protein Pcinc_003313 [Petrolisthes cinctipes]
MEKDLELPSISTGRRDIRGPPTVPIVTPGRPVRRRLDTSGDVHACLDDLDEYVISNEDNITNDELQRGRAVSQPHLPDRLSCQNYISRHFMELIPCEPRPNRRNVQRICVVCAHTKRHQRVRKRTSYQCHECKVALCHPCFVDYHTISDY